MCLLLSVDVHKPYMPLEFFAHRDFVKKLYIVSIGPKSVILGKLLYAVSAWWGFSSVADRQRLQALLHRGIRSGLCSSEVRNTLSHRIGRIYWRHTFRTHLTQPISRYIPLAPSSARTFLQYKTKASRSTTKHYLRSVAQSEFYLPHVV